jgi:hypothetical protein
MEYIKLLRTSLTVQKRPHDNPVVDSEMNAGTSHVISVEDIIYPRPTSGNTGGW